MGDSVVTPRAIAGCDMAACAYVHLWRRRRRCRKRWQAGSRSKGRASCTPASCKIDCLGQEAFGNTDNAFWVILLAEIATFGYAEALRTGLVDNAFPELEQGDIYPGGRFDPLNNLGMGNLEELKLKELKHCRLAMFAWLGLIAQAFATNPNGPSDNVGPIANWSAHVADPSGVNIVSVFANR